MSKCGGLLIFALLTVLCISSGVQAQSLTMEQAMLRFFEQFRCRMVYEQENIGLPRLDPMKEDAFELEVDDDALGQLKITMKNVTVEGLSNFRVPEENLMFNAFTLDFTLALELPLLHVSGWYSLSGEIQDLIELRGSGDFDLTLEDVRLFMDANMGHEGEEVVWWMNRVSLQMSLGKMSGFMAGIMEDEVLEDFFNYVLNNAMPEMIEEVFPELEPAIAEYAKEMVPDLLNGTPLLDVINIIFLEKEFLMPLPEDECPVVDPVRNSSAP